MTGDDRALVRRIVERRDPAAFAMLYARHTPVMYAMALRLVGNTLDAEDCVHDGWVRAIEGIARFRADSSVRTWLVGVVLNRVRESWRERDHVPLDDVPDSATGTPSLPHGVDAIDLERAIATLPRGYRAILLLHDVEGFTHDEIGAMLGIDAGTSRSQLARGRQRLRQALSDHGGGR